MSVASPGQSTTSDAALLQRYIEDRDDAAFGELVQRYVRLVHSAAVRRVGDRHLAEDVTQAVFLIFSKKARSAARVNPLSAWLVTTVKYAAANAMKIEARRRRRESDAAQHGNVAAWASADPSAVLLWQELAAHLDDAVLKLASADRAAVLLRYFDHLSVAEIAAELNSSEGAIKQRLHRSLEKLRAQLERRGAMLEGVVVERLANVIEARALGPVPPGLASGCASASRGVATAQTINISKGALKMMSITKAKLTTAIAAVALAGGARGVMQLHHVEAADPTTVHSATVTNLQVDPIVQAKVEAAPPVVLSTEPVAGRSDVDPSITEIRVTYSKEMADNSWSWCQTSDDTFPKNAGKVHYEPGHRVCVMPVKLEPGKVYKIYLNRGEFMNFADTYGTPALPYALVFGTKK